MPTPLETVQERWRQNYSDMPFEVFLQKRHEKFYSDMPFSDYTDKLGLTVPPQEVGNQQQPAPLPSVDGMYPMDKPPSEQVVRPIMEYGGLLAGGTAGAASPVPGGSVIGAGLGYGMGKGAADWMYGTNKDKSVGENLLSGAKDVATGAAMEAGGQLAGKAIEVGGKAIVDSKLAQRLYASAIKFPLSKKWRKVRSPEDISMIEQATNKGIEEKVPPSLYGIEKAKAGKANALKEIQSGVNSAVGVGNTDEIVANGLARAVKQSKSADAPLKEAKAIEDFAEAFKAGRAGELTPKEMQEIKVWLHGRANYDKVSGKSDALLETMRKGVAHELRLKLEAMNPALRASNQSYSDWKVLEEALELSLPRRNNRDMIDLGTKVLLGRESWPLAILNATVGHPQVKAQIAFMLKNAGKATGASVTRPAAYVAGPDLLSQ